MLIFPAHGALGAWDEIIFLGVVVVFVAMMLVSWLRGQPTTDESGMTQADTPDTAVDENRFELK